MGNYLANRKAEKKKNPKEQQSKSKPVLVSNEEVYKRVG
jgi:hypothetical protein